ncbi:hypothetical protein SRHO_G00212310 [Serrasalmus rhombeus]
MELTAAVVAARMDRLWRRELRLPLLDSVFWTDSTSVLKWINNETSRFRIFVPNRVSEILKASKASQWRYVNTTHNPTDFASRGMRAEPFLINTEWISGPAFLMQPEKEWPVNPEYLQELPYEDPEVKVSAAINVLQADGDGQLAHLISRTSSWTRLVRVMGWILRFKTLLLHRRKDKAHFQSASDSSQRKDVHHRVGFCDGFLSLEEIKDAEMQIIKFCQRKRRGQVQELRSDNGTNLMGAEHELRQAMEEWNQERIADALALKGVKWIFNPPTGSHHGGAWEQLIRSIRKVLNSTLQTQYLDEEGLQTVLCEVESILNSRPITQESTDPNDLEALTLNHLLLLKSNPCLPPGLFQKNDLYARKRWRQVQYISELFWKRWIKEYLPQLQQCQKWAQIKRNFIPGDVVLIVDDSAPCGSWIIGRVTAAVPDRKGLVRQVWIKTSTSHLCRPVTKICLLQEATDS